MWPDKFNEMTEPGEAEEWLRGMDIIFDTMGYLAIEKRRLATYQLTHAVANWWESKKATLGKRAI